MNDSLTSKFSTDKTEEVRRLGMGRLLDDLSTKMQHKAVNGDKDPLKILVHSTHDTALAGLASTLDVFDDKLVLDHHFLLTQKLITVIIQMASIHKLDNV